MKRYFLLAAVVLFTTSVSVYAYRIDWQKIEDGRLKYTGDCSNGARFAGSRDGVYESRP